MMDSEPKEVDHFKGIKENCGVSRSDLDRGHTDGMSPNEKKRDYWDVYIESNPLPGDKEEGSDGGFLGRGRRFER